MSASAATPFTSRRNLVVVATVVLCHAAVLWALRTGLQNRPPELLVPVAILSEIITPPAPKVEPPAPPPARPVERERPAPQPRKVPAPPPPSKPAPIPAAAPELPAAPAAPTGTTQAQPAPPALDTPVAVAPSAAPAPAPARVELPSTTADYLHNPKPEYPRASQRLGEQGKVLVHVLIGPDGTALDARLKQSSGYDRLDRAALETVRKWRYVPGKRGGVPEAMWFDVPVNFVLE